MTSSLPLELNVRVVRRRPDHEPWTTRRLSLPRTVAGLHFRVARLGAIVRLAREWCNERAREIGREPMRTDDCEIAKPGHGCWPSLCKSSEEQVSARRRNVTMRGVPAVVGSLDRAYVAAYEACMRQKGFRARW
jgi:hypothetical protein